MNAAPSWPAAEAFQDLAGVTQITDGRVRCVAAALCDGAGQAARSFAMGDTAHFYLEFEVLQRIGVPSAGIEFHTPAGVVVHGKNSYQSNGALPPAVKPGSRLRFHQSITLAVAPGEYAFSAGLATADEAAYRAYAADTLGHGQFAPEVLCRVVDVAAFSVTFDPKQKLSHHGIADLPGASRCEVVAPSLGIPFLRPRAATPERSNAPVVVHVTHWKAGSQWIHKILNHCAPELVVPPRLRQDQFLYWPIQGGKVYPTVYLTKPQYDAVALPPGSRRFVVIRDLRDTLASAYFSMKISHPISETGLVDLRATLSALSMEDGMLYLMDHWLPGCAAVQTSWLDAGEAVVRYEDLLENDLEILEPLLLDRCGLPVERARLRAAVADCRFQKLTAGRERGEEDIAAHERKGVAGDWTNHFTPRIKRAFKSRFGGLLVASGYEQDLDW